MSSTLGPITPLGRFLYGGDNHHAYIVIIRHNGNIQSEIIEWVSANSDDWNVVGCAVSNNEHETFVSYANYDDAQLCYLRFS